MADISKAIIMNIHEFEERDGIINAIFEDGRVMEVFAQGVQVENSKNMRNLQQFSIVEMEYFQRKDWYKAKLMRSTTIKSATMKDLRDLNAFFAMASALRGLNNVGKEIYELLVHIIEDIEFKTININEVFYYLTMILVENNIKPKVDKCAICGTQHRISGFDLKYNGLLCVKHIEDRERLEPDFMRKIIALFEAQDVNDVHKIMFTPQETIQVRDMFINFMSDNLGLYLELLRNV